VSKPERKTIKGLLSENRRKDMGDARPDRSDNKKGKMNAYWKLNRGRKGISEVKN